MLVPPGYRASIYADWENLKVAELYNQLPMTKKVMNMTYSISNMNMSVPVNQQKTTVLRTAGTAVVASSLVQFTQLV